MESFILLIAITFLGLVGFAVFILLKEPQNQNVKGSKVLSQDKNKEIDLMAQFQRKITAYEEQLKNHEATSAALQLELAQTKEREKTLLKEKSQMTFDEGQYEKFKKEYQALKRELIHKEEILEQEISQRRKHLQDLTGLQQDCETYKKQNIEFQDAYRKSQTIIETLTEELQHTEKRLDEQSKIVREHTENKIEGEWVSRDEFEKLEKELKEKEAFLQRLLALKSKNE